VSKEDKNLVIFNKWHGVELVMGQIARFDTYLDVCFVSLLLQCEMWLYFIPVSSLVALYIIFPLYMLARFMLDRQAQTFKHTLPNIEKCCSLSFLRENMLLATVMDSFCLNNSIKICGKEMTFGRQMGFWTLVTQDGPQYMIHLLFLFFDKGPIPHTEFTILMSLVVSTFAIQISIFNIIMCIPNEFDPTLIQLEFARRANQKQAAVNARDEVRLMMNKQKDILKKSITHFDPTVKRISKIDARAEMIQALGNAIDNPIHEEPQSRKRSIELAQVPSVPLSQPANK